MTEKYEVQVLPVNCEQLRAEDIREILGQVLLEFPVTEIDFSIPKWLEILPNSHWLKSEVIQAVRGMMDRTVHMQRCGVGAAGGNRGSDPPDPDCINENG